MPHAGMFIDPGSGDLYRVEGVYWYADDGPGRVEVELCEDFESPRQREYYERGGWLTNDLPQRPKKAKKAKEKRRG